MAQNREFQERLARATPEHPCRSFGEAVEASGLGVGQSETATASQHELAQTVATAIADAMAKFEVVMNRFVAAQSERQAATLQNVEETLLEIRRGQLALEPATHPTDPEIIDVDAAPSRGRAIRVSEFLMEQWKDEWYHAGVETKSFLLQFSVLLKSKVGGRPSASAPLRRARTHMHKRSR